MFAEVLPQDKAGHIRRLQDEGKKVAMVGRRHQRRSRARRGRPDNFIQAGTTPDPNPPLRVGFVGQCPDGTFSWGFVQPAPTQFDTDLKNVSVSGTFANVRDNRGGLHTVSVDARWTGTGPVMTTVNGPGSMTKERSATATATIVFDGNTLVNGDSNFPFPAPFIRVDIEK